jgi:hypothetical protein
MPEEEYLDVEQVQALLGVSRATVWNIINRYNLERFHIPARGKKTLVRKSALMEALNRPVPVRRRRGQQEEGKVAA